MHITDNDLSSRTLELIAEHRPTEVDQFAFRGAQFDAGLAWVHFPEGKGGLGLSRSRQSVVNRELRIAGVTYQDLYVNPLGIGMAAPTLLAYAREEVQLQRLRRIFTGEDIWCQLFSEPSHGSDVAGISTRAVQDGNEWIINGQKVWTTLAHLARYGLLLARTNPEVPKHSGLSYFILDMQSPGIDVRPLFQLTGEAEFNEVFLTDVRVNSDQMLGSAGDGWMVATTTLMNERVALSGGGSGKGGGPIDDLTEIWHRREHELGDQERTLQRSRVIQLWIRSEVLRLTNKRARIQARSGTPGPEGAVGKAAAAELNQAIYETAIDLLGAGGLLHEPGYPMIRGKGVGTIQTTTMAFLRSWANTIEGGTSEILRNILAERMLGLPRDTRTDRSIPWNEIPK